jgi:hypothetical protein
LEVDDGSARQRAEIAGDVLRGEQALRNQEFLHFDYGGPVIAEAQVLVDCGEG